MAWYMLGPGEVWHGILYVLAGMVYGIWYGLVGMAWYVVGSDGHGMAYGIWYGMAGMA